MKIWTISELRNHQIDTLTGETLEQAVKDRIDDLSYYAKKNDQKILECLGIEIIENTTKRITTCNGKPITTVHIFVKASTCYTKNSPEYHEYKDTLKISVFAEPKEISAQQLKFFRVEFGFGENFQSVDEFQTTDGLRKVEAASALDAAMTAQHTDGLGNALFRVYELDENGEPIDQHNPELIYF